MLEWLSTRLSIVFASILLLSSVTSYFAWERDYATTQKLETITRGLASFIDSSLRINGQAEFIISYKDEGDLVIPTEVGGQSYDLKLMNDAVVLRQEGRTAIGRWSGFLHLWKPEVGSYSSSKIESEDARHSYLDLISGQPFQISLRRIHVDRIEQTHAFAYPLT